jgi:hypothetical protein
MKKQNKQIKDTFMVKVYIKGAWVDALLRVVSRTEAIRIRNDYRRKGDKTKIVKQKKSNVEVVGRFGEFFLGV